MAVLLRQGEGQLDRPFLAVLQLHGLDSQQEMVLQGSWSLVELQGSLCQENLPVAELGRHLVLADSLRVGDNHFHP